MCYLILLNSKLYFKDYFHIDFILLCKLEFQIIIGSKILFGINRLYSIPVYFMIFILVNFILNFLDTMLKNYKVRTKSKYRKIKESDIWF